MKASLKTVRKIILETLGEAPSAHDELSSIYSDVFKEKYGVRPRHIEWDAYSVEELQAMLDRLYDEKGYDDDYDYVPEPHEPGFYPDMEGTVTDELPASVRSGGDVRVSDEEPDVRISKTHKSAKRNGDFTPPVWTLARRKAQR